MAQIVTIRFSKKFKKQYKRLPVKIQSKFDQRFRLWQKNPDAPELRRHYLKGEYKNVQSINITGDIRALYEQRSNVLVVYLLIGSHSELYK